jgi:putative membrane-bound dehydrogenase-like protein
MKKILVPAAICIFSLFGWQCKTKQSDATAARAEQDSAYAKLSDEDKRLSKNALAGLQVADGLQAQLFASEPMIGNPTNIDIDSRGRVWVCEALNYRPQLNPENPQRAEGDRIMILEDTNGDGNADTSKVFYQGNDVNAALGVAVLGNKVIVSCSPNVFVFTDTNGDDKPDSKEVLFSHIGGEQHDHAIHSFTFGPDGKLYFNFGNAGERLFDKAGKPLKDRWGREVNNSGKPYRQGMVFRINPDGSDLEVLAHNFRNNYEAAIDSYGTIWQSDNDDDGNQGVRINYVMEFGNYGYTDELTGAGWQARRTNLEPEIPKRHWHQNDPGSIPNLLLTGAGSPAGMIVYEGNLLPERFRNQMIHSDAGPNIVRSYAVENNGSGYKATINPILEGVRDQWFRPIDVCTAPDGSIFVADWYDPGVGGHQMGDLNRGRIYRITPNNEAYKIPSYNLNSADGAIAALQNPNLAIRYLAWEKLHSLGAQAEPALEKLWTSANPRFRARAFWLLAKLPGKEVQYINQGLSDKDPNIRITAIRAARQMNGDVIPFLRKVVADNDPQVRREVALALHMNKSPEAANLWAQLAKQYDGKDRWYLEALGIGADTQWQPFLAAYQQVMGNNLNSAAARDIVWRARTGAALPLLATAITDDATDSATRLKYFRAFDFIDDPAKENTLLALLNNNGPHKEQILIAALNTLSPASLAKNPAMQQKLNEALDYVKGKQEFVDLAGRYNVRNRNQELFDLAMRYPDSSLAAESANLLLKSGGSDLLKQAVQQKDDKTAAAALKTLSKAGTKEAMAMMQAIITDPNIALAKRQEAVKMLGTGWMESEYLLNMVKSGKLGSDLKPTAAVALSGAYRKDIRQEALKYLSTASTNGGKALPTIAELAKQSGNATAGRKVFTSICATCHQVGEEGVRFGPALSAIGNKLTKDALYVAILHPDAGISFGYEGFIFTLKDGSKQAGIIASETEDAVELVMPGGVRKKLSKSQISSRKEMENSMMPANLQLAMSQQDLVNLVEFLYAQKNAGAKEVASR